MADSTPDNEIPAPPTPGLAPVDKVNVAEEIKNSFLDYSMSVIVSRALPDVRDGLKPSQRRILFAMHDLSLTPNRPHRKCAKICGDTSGNYHPHGEAVIYPTLVHMAQPWAMRDPLIDGQGNFGSVEGDPPAAMRYTEARMTHLGAILMEDMEKDTVDFVPNYDETSKEPTVFPSAFPNLLVNGCSGIAVGMATNIPPHNLGEIIDGVCATIDDPSIQVSELMKIVKGPDFPTGCTIYGLDPIRQYFETGRGSMKVRGKVEIETLDSGRERILIHEIPYMVNRATLVQKISELVNNKVITDISDVRDESSKVTRVVVELKRDAIGQVVLNQLYKFTQLETSFSSNMLAIDHGRPRIMGLKDLINCYIEHRREVILRRTRYELNKALRRAEILEGYLIALTDMDHFIELIRGSSSRDEAREAIMGLEFEKSTLDELGLRPRAAAYVEGREAYRLTEDQANAILDLRLYQLTGLEREKLQKEYEEVILKIEDLEDILAKESRVLTIIKDELIVIRDKYATPRLSAILPDEGEIAIEDLIPNEPVVITITHNGLIKRTNLNEYRSQKRGGKGVLGVASTKKRSGKDSDEQDFIEHLFTASAHDYLMFFTNTGRVYSARVHEAPDLGRTSKGRSIANLLELQEGEKIAELIRIESVSGEKGENLTWQQPYDLLFATRNGRIKKTALEDFGNIRKGGIIAINVDDADYLIEVKLTQDTDDVVLTTRQGKSIRFHATDARRMGRTAAGVRGISLAEEDQVVSLEVVDNEASLLVVGERGIGKRTVFSEYRLQSRGGKGIITMKTSEKTGQVVGALTLAEEDELMLMSSTGQMIRIRANDIRLAGRNTQGVKLVNLDPKEYVIAIAPVRNEDTEEESNESEESEADISPDLDDKTNEDSSPENDTTGEE